MSSLSAVHAAMVEQLFESSPGYVLDFSNAKFQQFVLLTIGIDIYKGPGYDEYCSKMNKLRQIIQDESDDAVGKLLEALLQYRELIIQRRIENDDTYCDPYAASAERLKAVAASMQIGKSVDSSNPTLNARIVEARALLARLVDIGSSLCNNATYTYNKLEDNFNDYFRDMLKVCGYVETHDQTRHGFSSNGVQAG